MDFQVTPLETQPIPPTIVPEPIDRRFNPKKIRRFIKPAVWGVLFLLAVIAIFFFLNRKPFSEGRVEFKIEGPKEIYAGELVNYKINYQNNNKVELREVKLTFFYPNDAIAVKDGNPTEITNETFELDAIGVNQGGEQIISAYLVGDRGNIKTAKAILTFKPSNIRSIIKKELTLASTISSLAVPVTLVAPPSLIDGQSVSYLIDYRNQSQQEFQDLRIKVKYPEGFRFSSATPPPKDGQNTWDIAKLVQGNGSRITISGTIKGSERENKSISLVLQRKVAMPGGDTYIDFQKIEASSVIASAFLSLNAAINDSSNYVAHLGDDLQYTINFRNNSNVDITGLTLKATLEGGMFDASSVRSNAFFDSRSNTLTWDASIIPELLIMRPGQKANASFSVNIKNQFSGSTGTANSLVKVKIRLETQNIPPNFDTDSLYAEQQLITRISSAPVFDQRITLNDSVFGSNGPFPPKVDKKTVLTVRWTLVNPGNDLSPAKVSAVLAPGARWENQTRSGPNQPLPTYDQRTNSIVWDFSTLPAGVGLSLPKYETFFLISVTPSVNQVGQPAPILKNSRLDATDIFTKEKISRTVQDAGTFNVSDTQEQGTVQN